MNYMYYRYQIGGRLKSCMKMFVCVCVYFANQPSNSIMGCASIIPRHTL